MRRCLNIDEQIFINKFVQGINTLDDMRVWFEAYDLLNKKDIIHNLLCMVIQSHPTYDEIEFSAQEVKKITSPVAVKLLNRNKPFPVFGHEICDLPEKQLSIAFDILLLTLSKADNRNRLLEPPGLCNHWWHRDLSNEAYLNYLRKMHKT